jgi:hypothetical protein
MKFPTDVTEIDAIEDGNWLLVADASDNDASRKISIQNMFGGYDLFKYGMKYIALDYLKSLNPVALWVPGMQTDGFREENGVTYLTQLTDLSGNGNHAVQDTATKQAYLDGNSAVFSGEQLYDATGIEASGYFTLLYIGNADNSGYIFDSYGTGSTTRIVLRATALYYNQTYHSFPDGKIYYTETNDNAIDGPTAIGDTNAMRGYGIYIGTIAVLAVYNKILSDTEQSIVKQCLTILGE